MQRAEVIEGDHRRIRNLFPAHNVHHQRAAAIHRHIAGNGIDPRQLLQLDGAPVDNGAAAVVVRVVAQQQVPGEVQRVAAALDQPAVGPGTVFQHAVHVQPPANALEVGLAIARGAAEGIGVKGIGHHVERRAGPDDGHGTGDPEVAGLGGVLPRIGPQVHRGVAPRQHLGRIQNRVVAEDENGRAVVRIHKGPVVGDQDVALEVHDVRRERRRGLVLQPVGRHLHGYFPRRARGHLPVPRVHRRRVARDRRVGGLEHFDAPVHGQLVGPDFVAGRQYAQRLPVEQRLVEDLELVPGLQHRPVVEHLHGARPDVEQAAAHRNQVVGRGGGFVHFNHQVAAQHQVVVDDERAQRIARREFAARRHGHGPADRAGAAQDAAAVHGHRTGRAQGAVDQHEAGVDHGGAAVRVRSVQEQPARAVLAAVQNEAPRAGHIATHGQGYRFVERHAHGQAHAVNLQFESFPVCVGRAVQGDVKAGVGAVNQGGAGSGQGQGPVNALVSINGDLAIVVARKLLADAFRKAITLELHQSAGREVPPEGDEVREARHLIEVPVAQHSPVHRIVPKLVVVVVVPDVVVRRGGVIVRRKLQHDAAVVGHHPEIPRRVGRVEHHPKIGWPGVEPALQRDDRPRVRHLPERFVGIGCARRIYKAEVQGGLVVQYQRSAGQHDLIEVHAGNAGGVVAQARQFPHIRRPAQVQTAAQDQLPGAEARPHRPAGRHNQRSFQRAPDQQGAARIHQHGAGPAVAVDFQRAGIDRQVRHRVAAQHPIHARPVHLQRAGAADHSGKIRFVRAAVVRPARQRQHGQDPIQVGNARAGIGALDRLHRFRLARQINHGQIIQRDHRRVGDLFPTNGVLHQGTSAIDRHIARKGVVARRLLQPHRPGVDQRPARVGVRELARKIQGLTPGLDHPAVRAGPVR